MKSPTMQAAFFFAAITLVTQGTFANVILVESFETTLTGSVPVGWTIPFSGVSVGVVDTQASSGSKSIRLVGSGYNGANTHFDIASSSDLVSIRYDLRVDSAGWSGSDGEAKILFHRGVKRATAGILKRNGEYYFFDGSNRETSTVSAPVDQWVRVEFIMDFAENSVSSFFDGNLTFVSGLTEAPDGSFLQINSGNGSTSRIAAFYDNVTIEELATPRCQNDVFHEGVPPGWELTGIGNADQVSIAESGGALAFTADGATAYYGADNAGFLYQELAGDFRIESDLDASTMVTGKPWRKAGLMARASLDHLDIRLLAMLAPVQNRLQFVAREVYGGPGNVKLAYEITDVPLTARLAIERVGQTLTVQYSLDDGETWITPDNNENQGSLEIIDLPESLYVGLALVSNNISVTSTALFNNVDLCSTP